MLPIGHNRTSPSDVRIGGMPLALAILTQAIQILSATLSTNTVPVYGSAEVAVGLKATYTNPFDPAEIALDADITPPSGKKLQVPGYYAADGWHVRFSPQEPGQYT